MSLTLEQIDGLEVGHSILRVKATNQRGLYLGTNMGNITISAGGKGQDFPPDDLYYMGTPGIDCPHLDDYEDYI